MQQNPGWLETRIPGLFSGLSCLWLATVLFMVWLDPMAWDDGHWVPFGVGLLVIEFLALHSSVFITNMIANARNRMQKIKYGVGLLAFYLLTGVGIAMSIGSFSLVLILGTIMLARAYAAVNGDATTLTQANARAGLGITLYVLLCGATVFVELPEMGITRAVLDDVYPHRGGGVWEQHPERAIVAAAVYFLIMGFTEIRWAWKTPEPEAISGQ